MTDVAKLDDFVPVCQHCGGRTLAIAPTPISPFVLEDWVNRRERVLTALNLYCNACGKKVLARDLKWQRM